MDLTKLFLDSIKNSKEYDEAMNIMAVNSIDEGWIVGGFVFRNLAGKLYGKEIKQKDIDIATNTLPKELKAPQGWTIIKTRFDTPRFIQDGGSFHVDLFTLSSFSSIRIKKLAPTIDNYLSGVSLNIQSIVFDIKNKKILGESGIQALLNKEVKINNLENAEYSFEKAGISISEAIKKKAFALGFKAVIP